VLQAKAALRGHARAGCNGTNLGIDLTPDHAVDNLLPPSVTSRPVAGVAPTIDLSIGYNLERAAGGAGNEERSSFLKKRSKRLLCSCCFQFGAMATIVPQAQEQKFFASFFSKKKCLLFYLKISAPSAKCGDILGTF
jgi:hypothetical protein